jgi:hypothetical protein
MWKKINIRKHVMHDIALVSLLKSLAYILPHQSLFIIPVMAHVHCQHSQLLPHPPCHFIRYKALLIIHPLALTSGELCWHAVLIHCHSSSTLGFFIFLLMSEHGPLLRGVWNKVSDDLKKVIHWNV